MTLTQLKPLHILLVDDDEVDVMTVKRAFFKAKTGNTLRVEGNGAEALRALKAGDVPEPRIILLDLNMPCMTGIEFLSVLRNDPALKDEIVYILSTSNAPEDRAAAFDLGVEDYLVKDRIHEDLVNLVAKRKPYRIPAEVGHENPDEVNP
ncbi:MAG: response regulator [Planctomycetota bacterium]